MLMSRPSMTKSTYPLPTLTHVHRSNSARPAPKITPNYSLAYCTLLLTKYLGITTYHTKNTITLRIASWRGGGGSMRPPATIVR
jgi:hypothetical protein